MKEARGSRLWDVDDNEYIDILCGAGPAILGHSPSPVMEAVKQQIDRGTIVQVTTKSAIELAKKITQHMPGMEVLRFVNSGSEAVHLALRTARAYTGKEKCAKFEGNYNGQLDNELISGHHFGGSEDNPESVPGSVGIPKSVVNDTITLPWNNTEATVALIKKHASELAAVILEPVGGLYLGGIPAEKSFCKALREITEQEGIVLIFDEVITGFRLGLSGVHSLLGVTPDLRTLGKIIGGGFPVGAYGGRKDIMEQIVTPYNPAITGGAVSDRPKIFSSGTFSGNPVSMTAGLATITELEKPGVYERIDGYGERIRNDLRKMAVDIGLGIQVMGVGSFFSVHFSPHPLKNIREILSSDRETAGAFYMGLEANGIHIPSNHLAFTSTAHNDDDIDKILEVAEKVFREIKRYQP
jgi:glutamate-1-semialdehyde 2,1-aminomutase